MDHWTEEWINKQGDTLAFPRIQFHCVFLVPVNGEKCTGRFKRDVHPLGWALLSSMYFHSILIHLLVSLFIFELLHAPIPMRYRNFKEYERTVSASITHSSADLVGLFRRLSRMMRLTCAQDEVTALIHLTLMRNSSGSNWPPFVNPTPSTGPPYVASILLLFLRTARALPYGNWLNEENNKTETNEVNLIDTNNYKKKFEGCQRTVKLLLHC